MLGDGVSLSGYGKRTVADKTSSFVDVGVPYYLLTMKNGDRYFFINTSSSEGFSSYFDPRKYLKELNEKIRQIITETN